MADDTVSAKRDVTSRLKAGDWARVILEGPVDAPGMTVFDIGTGPYQNSISTTAEHVVSVERLPDPEPEWRPGDVVLAANGNVWVRDKWMPTWRSAQSGVSGIHHNFPSRPLSLLVRNGALHEQEVGDVPVVR